VAGGHTLMGQATVKAIAEKILLLKTWSGRRGSNPRPTAWKIDRQNVFNHIAALDVDSGPLQLSAKTGVILSDVLMEG
jgi:hypothetical protein